MKKSFKATTIIILVMLAILAGCGKKSAPPGEEEENLIVAYEKELRGVMGESNDLLISYSNALDNLYTSDNSKDQISNIVKKKVSESSAILRMAEENTPDTELFAFHQELMEYLNNQHQLLLTTVSDLGQENPNPDVLRDTFLDVKKQQSELIHKWETEIKPEFLE